VDKFIRRENLALFRKRLAEAPDDATRQILLKLLAEVEAKEPPSRPKSSDERRSIEFTLVQVEPGLWQWQFRIGETLTTRKTKTYLKGLAARWAQQRIDHGLETLATEIIGKQTARAQQVLPKRRRLRDERI
jgi:hypothetical protein